MGRWNAAVTRLGPVENLPVGSVPFIALRSGAAPREWRGVGSKRELGATVLPMVVKAGFADYEN